VAKPAFLKNGTVKRETMLTNLEQQLMQQIDFVCGSQTKAVIPILQLEPLFTIQGQFDLIAMEKTFLSLFQLGMLDATFIKSKNGQFVFVKLTSRGMRFASEQKHLRRTNFARTMLTILMVALSVALAYILLQRHSL